MGAPAMTRSVNIHATCVRLGRAGAAFGAPPDAGVLLLGKSGAGKSDLALRLIALGATLVADDRTELYLWQRKLYARPPANTSREMAPARPAPTRNSPTGAEPVPVPPPIPQAMKIISEPLMVS